MVRCKDDTNIGGGDARFPDTQTSLIADLRDSEPTIRARAAGRLTQAYWKPIYKYARARWRKSNDEAKDIVQGFLTEVFARPSFLAAYDPARARFRTYIRLRLGDFVSNQYRHARRDATHESVALPFDFNAADPEDNSWETWFGGEVARHLLDTAVDALRASCEARGKLSAFEVFRARDIAQLTGPRASYEDIAAALNITKIQVTNDLHRMRKALREFVKRAVREYASSDEEYRDELKELFGIDLDCE